MERKLERMIAITSREAKKILIENGWEWLGEDDGRSYYATYEDLTKRNGAWSFDSKKERDEFVKRHNS